MTPPKNWDGKITNMQVSAESNPELFAELAALKPKERSTRLRSLALLGWFCINQVGSSPVRSPAFIENQGPPQEASAKNNSTRSNLVNKLLESVST